jgi:hypothetical protein
LQASRIVETQSAVEQCRFALVSTASTTTVATTTATTTTTACNQHDAQYLAQGHHEVFRGPQQCRRQCHFQTVPSTSAAFGKVSQEAHYNSFEGAAAKASARIVVHTTLQCFLMMQTFTYKYILHKLMSLVVSDGYRFY